MDNKIRILRAKHKFTQQKLAELLGVSRQTVHMIEQNKYNPSLDLAFRLSGLFNESIENLFIHHKTTVVPPHHVRSYR
jgi:putative transcriptional regulator|tara:strand:- start:3342 stop:3575 length:234 start_codon:yes stop_codon:yes gene_type:complete